MKKALTLALVGALAAGSAWAAGWSQQRSEMQGGQSSQQWQQRQSLSQDTVRQLQEQLQNQGYEVGQIDGVMGPRTQQALRDFQRDQNLQATGRPDQETLAALGIESDSQQAEMPQDQRRQQRGQGVEQPQDQQSR